MRFLFACGGTAGHINPALAVAGKLRELFPDAKFLFVGSGREMENRLIPAAGYELRNITITGFNRSMRPEDIKHNLNTIHNLSVARHQCEEIVTEFRPDIAVGTGGYVCYPILTAAARHGIPTAMHESNAVPGLTTKLLSGVVDRVMVAFPDAEHNYKRPERVTVTGTPIRGDFLPITREEAKRRLGITGKPLVVSFWGSLGAEAMNAKMADFIRLNSMSGEMYHLHATGNGDTGVKKMEKRLGEMGVYGLPDWEDLRPYIDNMGTVMTAADLILCRAGASTLAELTALGRAAILVPSPNVTNNHQEKNARKLESSGGAVVMLEEGLTGEQLYNMAVGLTRDRTRLASIETSCRRMGRPDACGQIVAQILELAQTGTAGMNK